MSTPASEIKKHHKINKIHLGYPEAILNDRIQFLSREALKHRYKQLTNSDDDFYKNVAAIGLYDDREKNQNQPKGFGVQHSSQAKGHPKGLHSERLALLQALQAAVLQHLAGNNSGFYPKIPEQTGPDEPTNLEKSGSLKHLITSHGKNYLSNFPKVDIFTERDFCTNSKPNSIHCKQFFENILPHDLEDRNNVFYAINHNDMSKQTGRNGSEKAMKALREQAEQAYGLAAKEKIDPWYIPQTENILNLAIPQTISNNNSLGSFTPNINDTNNNTNPEVTESILSSLSPQIINPGSSNNRNSSSHNKIWKKKDESKGKWVKRATNNNS